MVVSCYEKIDLSHPKGSPFDWRYLTYCGVKPFDVKLICLTWSFHKK
ncbi:hypothetical protein HMPREF3226_00989 [Prevotella corporis]|uniref:Uncharacterized protein n=1 Tax=Prevotella corporis TaxID=28128 RepID=A0A133QCY3_9BACT|nr:hypothetical protein HMPREF3226_00989 [Prevotella corporis]